MVRSKKSTEYRNSALDKLIENPYSFSKINNTKPRVFPITQSKKKFTYSGSYAYKRTHMHHPLNPLPPSAFKYDYEPVEYAIKNCHDPTLPHKVKKVLAKVVGCDHVIQHTNGMYEIRLYNGKSVVINTSDGYDLGGNKTLKHRSRR
jgi:hypothetical protein